MTLLILFVFALGALFVTLQSQSPASPSSSRPT